MPSLEPRKPSPAVALAGESFSFAEAVGGWRGFIESVTPGVLFVICFLVWGGFRVPVIAAAGAVAALVIVRLAQRASISQALSGTVGVALGAIWAWRAGDPGEYFVPGFWITAAYGTAALLSIVVRWPMVGIAMALIKGWGTRWRADRAVQRRMALATAVFAISQAIKLAVQLPLYFAGAVGALGTARLAMGLPYFALTLWVIWLMVRDAAPAPVQPDRRPQT